MGGQREIEFRAVKMIPKLQQPSKPIDYNRELEAIAKFSHWRVCRSVWTSSFALITQLSNATPVRAMLC